MTELTFALVGCGRIAPKHAEALESLPGARLVAVCDVKEDRASRFGAKYGVPSFVDLHDMLGKVKADVVAILTPSGLHAGYGGQVEAKLT